MQNSRSIAKIQDKTWLRIFHHLETASTENVVAAGHKFHSQQKAQKLGNSKCKQLTWSPIEIATVCKSWAKVAFSDPSLWIRPLLPFIGEVSDLMADEILANTVIHLKHSQNMPIHPHIFIIDGKDTSSVNMIQLRRACYCIWNARHRWESITVLQYTRHEIVDFPIRSTVLGSLVHLETDKILMWRVVHMQNWIKCTHLTIYIDARSQADFTDRLEALPSLKALHLHMQLGYPTGLDITPRSTYNDMLIDIFSKIADAVELEELHIIVPDNAHDVAIWKSSNEPPLEITCSMDNLHTIYLGGYTPGKLTMNAILARCSFPSLCHFSMQETLPEWFDEALIQWKCSLRSLSITMRPDEPLYRIPVGVVRATTSVTMLTIRAYQYARSPAIIEQLCHQEDAYPNLQHLHLVLFHYTPGSRHGAREDRTALEGFDYGSTLLYLLKKRPKIESLEAIVSYPHSRVRLLDSRLKASGKRYLVTVYTEDSQKFTLTHDTELTSRRMRKPLMYRSTGIVKT